LVARDEVNQAMIRHWTDAIGDDNPVYTDEEAALANGFSGVVAPPTMLQAWVMRGFRAHGDAASNTDPSAQERLFGLLDAAGFTSVVATNCEQEYTRPLVLGDRVTASSVIESVSEEKATGLGDGHFVTTRVDFTDDHDGRVATMRFRILRFRPRVAAGRGSRPDEPALRAQPAPTVQPAPVTRPAQVTRPAPATRPTPGGQLADAPRRPRPAITQDIAFFFEGAREGKLLIQRCTQCGLLRHPPRPACASCRSFEWDTVTSSGRGTVFSFVVVHHPQVPGFDYPLPIAVVELEEGTRLVADLIGTDPADVVVGMPVLLEMVAVDDELTLPMFSPAD
jgi:uncharacterized OB-fold protein/acyl dehydratase